ncbi:kinesin family member 11 [Apiospora sp. TS-2023a]
MVLPKNTPETAQGQTRILASWVGPADARQDGHGDLEARWDELREREQRQRLAELDVESKLESLDEQRRQTKAEGSPTRETSVRENTIITETGLGGDDAAQAVQEANMGDSLRAELQSIQQQLADTMRRNAELLTRNSILTREARDLRESRRLFFHHCSSHRQNMEVMVRFRPLKEEEKELPTIVMRQSRPGRLKVSCPSEPSLDDAIAHADRIFDHTATNEDIHFDIVRHSWSLLEGHGVCIAAYGQMGSGKTYTISYISREIVAELLGNVLQEPRASTYTLKARCVEVYLEGVYDLLSGGDDGATRKLQVRDDPAHGLVTVEGCTHRPVKSEKDWESILEQVERSRKTTSVVPKGHLITHRSSRSSLILTIIMEGVTDGKQSRAQLDLVDLAGSEGIPESAGGDPSLKERAAINSCLLTLGRVVDALGNHSTHVPYSDHVLTKLLKYSLGFGARSLFLVTVSPLAKNFPRPS